MHATDIIVTICRWTVSLVPPPIAERNDFPIAINNATIRSSVLRKETRHEIARKIPVQESEETAKVLTEVLTERERRKGGKTDIKSPACW